MIGISNILMSWIPTYLVTVKGFTSVKMGFLASAPFLGAVAGNMLGGIVSDRLIGGRRKPMMMLGALGTVVMMLLLIDRACAPLAVGILLDRYSWTSVFLYMVGTALLWLLLLVSVVEPLNLRTDSR